VVAPVVGLRGDGFAEFQGGGYDVPHLAAEADQVLVNVRVAAPPGFEAAEFGLEVVDLVWGQVRGAGVGPAVQDCRRPWTVGLMDFRGRGSAVVRFVVSYREAETTIVGPVPEAVKPIG
jgi:hypothetical protein